ncbi:MAG: hypothetical protein HC788_11000 [Sphingopyxis sp.]|nr:hypothetical protein [Sphingopyxis sp.]
MIDEIQKIGLLYCACMDQVAAHLDALNESLEEAKSNPNHSENWKNAEFSYLQVRKCVEYSAVALLAAHSEYDQETIAMLQTDWKADRIFHALSQLNPHGFPTAGAFQINGLGQGQHHIAAPRFTLSRSQMKKIYDGTGAHLHAPKLADIINNTIRPHSFAKLHEWRDKILLTLQTHTVKLPHKGLVMLVWLREANTGHSKVVFGKADGQFVIGDDPNVFNAEGEQ